jgi:hypothetical protein
MSRIDLQDTPYLGTTSRPASGVTTPNGCLGCGSSLGGRKQPSRWATVGRTRFIVHVWACRCGRRRTIRQEVAAH